MEKKTFVVTLEIEAVDENTLYENLLKKIVSDERTLSFKIEEQNNGEE